MAGHRVPLALGAPNHYPGSQMRNPAFVGLILFSLATPVGLSGRSADSERTLFDQVKAKAEKGDPEAQLELGSLYANGTGVAADPGKAFKWHRKAADQGLARAQYQLGLDYANGEGVKPDKPVAVHWFHEAAQKGLAQAQLELGLCYLDGRGISPNGTEALKWFRSASSQGLALADYEIGLCYLQGVGIAKDIEQGTRWITRAAEKGVAASQNSLGLAYEKGEGVPQDYVQAYKWFALAAAQDDEHAADIRVSLAKLEAVLTKDQIAEAQRLASEFKPRENPAPTPPQDSAAGTTSLKATEPSKAGVVSVKADDQLSEVFVDGAFVGNSPAKLRLAEGQHLIEVKRAGFKSYQRELKVTAGCELNLHAILEKQ